MSQAFAQSARRLCSECGSSRIVWTTAGALAAQDGPQQAVDAALVEWVWLGQRQQAWVWRAAVKHRAVASREDPVPSASS